MARSFLNSSIYALARYTALLGGIVLIAVVIMSCVSIIGRALSIIGLSSIPGDFEMVEMGIGFAVFASLPWCHLNKGHASVDLFQPAFGRYLNAVIDVVADALMFVVSALIARQLWLGMLDKKQYSETTFILQFPVYYAYAAAMLGAVVFVIVSLYCFGRSIGRAKKEFAQ
ncbi:MAG: TRAP transporter small permease [Paracoccaceae bacterium]